MCLSYSVFFLKPFMSLGLTCPSQQIIFFLYIILLFLYPPYLLPHGHLSLNSFVSWCSASWHCVSWNLITNLSTFCLPISRLLHRETISPKTLSQDCSYHYHVSLRQLPSYNFQFDMSVWKCSVSKLCAIIVTLYSSHRPITETLHLSLIALSLLSMSEITVMVQCVPVVCTTCPFPLIFDN